MVNKSNCSDQFSSVCFSEQCNAPLGMESGLIADSDLTCSSTHDVTSVGPQMARWGEKKKLFFFSSNRSDEIWFNIYFDLLRIRTELEGGAWCPDKPIGLKSYEYIQIEFHQFIFLTAVETQGRFDNGQGNEYAEFYQIQYQRDNNSSHWIDYYNRKTNKTVGELLERNHVFLFSM